MKSPLEAAIEQINGMGYKVEVRQVNDFGNIVWSGFCWQQKFGGKSKWSEGKTIEEAVLNLLDKLKTQKELG